MPQFLQPGALAIDSAPGCVVGSGVRERYRFVAMQGAQSVLAPRTRGEVSSYEVRTAYDARRGRILLRLDE